ncbi:MAG: DUF3034 family protein [Rhodospirillaceae bacterium]|nr:DUF3034 family protein [Rhodospirillaceae bacterium]
MLAALYGAVLAAPVSATPLFESGKLLATGGVSQVEGAGGGGLVPWALITGYGTRDAVGASAHYTHVFLPDYTQRSGGVAVGLYDRVELSFARQWFDTGVTGTALDLGAGFTFHQNIFGAKVRLIGDAVYEQDSWLPQIALGIQYKKNDRLGVIRAVGGESDEGVDIYVAATKILLEHSLLVNGTVRLTKANQFGILGFGGDANNSYRPEFEGSVAYLVSRRLALGGEYRTKPNNLRFAAETDAWDVFGAYFISKNASLTLAYADLGSIATKTGQRGLYLSVQAGF